MATAIESGIGALNYGRQPAKGTKATAATTTVGYDRPKLYSGELTPKKTLGSEEYVDGQRFASPSQFTTGVGGEVGQVVIQAQPENVGLYYAQVLAVDIVTGASDPYTHTITSAGAAGLWGTWWQAAGAAVGPLKQMFWDSKIGKLLHTCGRDQIPLHLAMDILAIEAGELYTTAPAKTENASDPYYWTEITGAITFDGTVNSDVQEETIEVDTKLSPEPRGDGIKPTQLIENKGLIVRTLKSIVTDATLAKYYKAIYNDPAPAGGTSPVKDVFFAAVSTVYTKSATRTLTITTPRVAVKPDEMVIASQREGGAIPISFGGECLKNGGTPALSVVVLSGESGAYA